MGYDRIKKVEAKDNFTLRVEFFNGVIKVYDCKPLLKEEPFKLLQNENFFKRVKVDSGGYGISWNDDIDLAESELWLKGVSVNTQVAEDKSEYKS